MKEPCSAFRCAGLLSVLGGVSLAGFLVAEAGSDGGGMFGETLVIYSGSSPVRIRAAVSR